jgi:hypothetical protein
MRRCKQPLIAPLQHRPAMLIRARWRASSGRRSALARSCFSSNRRWRESTRVHSGVDRFDADGTRVSGQESTSPPISRPLKKPLVRGRGLKCRCHRDFSPRSDSRRSTIIIMRATLHDPAPNTYYGQWPGEKPLFARLESPTIAHNELAASARIVAFDVPERDFPGNRSPSRWKYTCRPIKKNLRAWRSGALPAQLARA